MQSQITAGDTLNPLVSLADYPASAGWVLSYRLTPRSAGTAYTFSATAADDAYQLDVPAATTAGWAAGQYTLSAWVTSGSGERHTVPSEGGQVTVWPNPATLAAGTDTRSYAEIALDNINALLRGKALTGNQRYDINGRRWDSYPLPELLLLQARFKADVDAERVAAGLAPRSNGIRRILVRMP